MSAATPEYEQVRAAAAARRRRLSLAGRDIGAIPPIGNPSRRQQAERSLRRWCELYESRRYGLAWSDDHLAVIDLLERTIRDGALFAVAMPRGSGKTSLSHSAVRWGACCGLRRYILLVSANERQARLALRNIKTELWKNALLAEDFPEVIYPIRQLENETRRCKGQLHHGQPTDIEWGKERIVLPTIPGSAASGTIIASAGLLGSSIRGLVETTAEGDSRRPDCAIIDDPQTKKSARSRVMTQERLETITADILGLAGPGKQIAAIVPCTVIYPGDAADQLLNRELHPEWNGRRTSLLPKFPDRMELWDEYAGLLKLNATAATKFYAQHRAEMDAGAVVAWPDRKKPAELSGLQHAMNLYLADPVAFASEYQNDPRKPDEEQERWLLTSDAIRANTSGLARGLAPIWATHLTAFVDVQATLLYWLVAAWGDGFSGTILDYGTWPEQPRRYFTLRNASPVLADLVPGQGADAAIHAGLTALAGHLATRDWPREGGGTRRLDKLGIDTGFQAQIVYNVCRTHSERGLLLPTKGAGITADRKPLSEYEKRPGETIGHEWRQVYLAKQGVQLLHFDSNTWKLHVQQRLATAVGAPNNGSLTLYGQQPGEHELLAEQLAAEFPTRTEGRGRTVYVWKPRPGSPDNHWLDCLVGAAALASRLGVTLAYAAGGEVGRPRRKITRETLKRRRIQ